MQGLYMLSQSLRVLVSINPADLEGLVSLVSSSTSVSYTPTSSSTEFPEPRGDIPFRVKCPKVCNSLDNVSLLVSVFLHIYYRRKLL